MPHDLRQLFRAVGRFNGQRALTASPPDRTDVGGDVEVLDDDAAPIECAPMTVEAYVDGVQASLVMAHREHRPVYLSYIGAAAVDGRRRPVGIKERLHIVCSHLDREWVDSLGSTVPVEETLMEWPPDVEKAALASLGGGRAALEATLVDELLADTAVEVGGPGGLLVVDGALGPRTTNTRLCGVVKTHGTKYLPDERVLYGLPKAWRSPRFRIPAGVAGGRSDRYSCYVRMFDASDAAWSYGLIRVESYSLDLLEPLAARCLRERQSATSGDARYDRHLAPVRACEELLRNRRPYVYNL